MTTLAIAVCFDELRRENLKTPAARGIRMRYESNESNRYPGSNLSRYLGISWNQMPGEGHLATGYPVYLKGSKQQESPAWCWAFALRTNAQSRVRQKKCTKSKANSFRTNDCRGIYPPGGHLPETNN